jgi:ribosome-binding factor A
VYLRMPFQRVERIAEEIRKETSRILRDEVKDTRITQMVSIIRVEVTRDLRYAKIYVSVLGDEKERIRTMEGLKRASGFIRKQLGHILHIRYIPELNFVLDKSIEYSIYINKKLNEINKGRENPL